MNSVLSYYFSKDTTQLETTLLKYKNYAKALSDTCDKERLLINSLCDYNRQAVIFRTNAKLAEKQLESERSRIEQNVLPCRYTDYSDTNSEISDSTDEVDVTSTLVSGTVSDDVHKRQNVVILSLLLGSCNVSYSLHSLFERHYELLENCSKLLHSDDNTITYTSLTDSVVKYMLMHLVVYLQNIVEIVNKHKMDVTVKYNEYMSLLDYEYHILYRRVVARLLVYRLISDVDLNTDLLKQSKKQVEECEVFEIEQKEELTQIKVEWITYNTLYDTSVLSLLVNLKNTLKDVIDMLNNSTKVVAAIQKKTVF